MNGEIFQGKCAQCKADGEVQDMSDYGVGDPICYTCWMTIDNETEHEPDPYDATPTPNGGPNGET